MDDFENFFAENDNALSAEDVQRIAGEEAERRTVQTLQQIAYQNTLYQQAREAATQAKEAAIARTEEEHPGFRKMLEDENVCKRFIKEKPAIARMIVTAENVGSDVLDELYPMFYNEACKFGDTTTTARKPSTPDSANLSTPQSRRELIRSFDERGFGDVPIDLADDSEEGKRTRRY